MQIARISGPDDPRVAGYRDLADHDRLRARGASLPFAIEVLAFGDEEGTRFGTALLGSRAVAGTWEEAWWSLTDAAGTTLREAFVEFGLDPERVGEAAYPAGSVVGYLEAHIEQGPRLADRRIALAVVSTIVGIAHGRVTVRGRQDHAGTTPMGQRRDPLAAASELIAALEAAASARPATVATVGEIGVRPGAKNVIPAECTFSLDIRAPRERDIDAVLRSGRYDRSTLLHLAESSDITFDRNLFADALARVQLLEADDFARYDRVGEDVNALRQRFASWRADLLAAAALPE